MLWYPPNAEQSRLEVEVETRAPRALHEDRLVELQLRRVEAALGNDQS